MRSIVNSSPTFLSYITMAKEEWTLCARFDGNNDEDGDNKDEYNDDDHDHDHDYDVDYDADDDDDDDPDLRNVTDMADISV